MRRNQVLEFDRKNTCNQKGGQLLVLSDDGSIHGCVGNMPPRSSSALRRARLCGVRTGGDSPACSAGRGRGAESQAGSASCSHDCRWPQQGACRADVVHVGGGHSGREEGERGR